MSVTEAPLPVGRWWKLICAGLFSVGLALLATVALSEPLSQAVLYSVIILCFVLWAIDIVPSVVVSLLFFALASVLVRAPPQEIFSGFTSNAFWLVFSGTVISFALKETKLSNRVGALIAGGVGSSYLKALLLFASLSFLLSLVMPSTFGRVAVLLPIAIGYCDFIGMGEHRKGRQGIILLVAVGSYELAAAVLPANLPNLVMIGAAEQSLHMHFGFAEYLLYFLPAGVVVRGAVLVFASYRMFPDTFEPVAAPADQSPLSAGEKRLMLLLAAMLGLWLTDSIHHVPPAIVGLAFSALYLLLSTRDIVVRFTRNANLELLLFVAAILGMTSLIDHGSQALVEKLAFLQARTDPIYVYAVFITLSVGLCVLVTSNAAPSVLTPLVAKLTLGDHLARLAVLSQVMGYSTTFIPYQSPPIVFGGALAKLPSDTTTRYCLLTGIGGLLLVIPLNALWWKVLGLL